MTAPLQNVCEAKTVSVGCYYLVPCLSWLGQEVPVLGPLHPDPDLGVAEPHFHYDFRFLSNRQVHWLFPVSKIRGIPYALVSVHSGLTPEDLVLQRRRCHRKMPIFPMASGAKSIQRHSAMEQRYAETVFKPDCAVCPHRGMPLHGLPVDAEGCVVCPGHGLRWHLETGKLVPRYATDQKITGPSARKGGE